MLRNLCLRQESLRENLNNLPEIPINNRVEIMRMRYADMRENDGGDTVKSEKEFEGAY